MSERRACRVIDADRKSVRYRSIRDDDGALREKLRGLANQRRRFGYRRLHILLRRRRPPSGRSINTSCRCFDISMATSTASVGVELRLVMVGPSPKG
ncbi:hypothetical protein IQ25_04186 [Novosphingobium taihuense]|nr:hypothetical protein IQ25_04186 [Novosphingobium taihuense]